MATEDRANPKGIEFLVGYRYALYNPLGSEDKGDEYELFDDNTKGHIPLKLEDYTMQGQRFVITCWNVRGWRKSEFVATLTDWLFECRKEKTLSIAWDNSKG